MADLFFVLKSNMANHAAGTFTSVLKAHAAAPKPLSTLTTDTPGAQLFSIVSIAAIPPSDTPYPTLVGTANTGTLTSPPTTLGRALNGRQC